MYELLYDFHTRKTVRCNLHRKQLLQVNAFIEKVTNLKFATRIFIVSRIVALILLELMPLTTASTLRFGLNSLNTFLKIDRVKP